MLFNAQALCLVRHGQNIGIPLSFHTVRGDLIWVRGANGAGKSTLLQSLAGLLPSLASNTVVYADPKPSIFYLGHQLGLVDTLTAFEHCYYHPTLAKPTPTQIKSVFEILGIADLGVRLCSQLSRGQQQRVAMAVGLLSEATLWLLDEPFTGQDIAATTKMKACIQAQAQQGAVIVVSHQDISDIATQTLTLGEGVYHDA